MSVLGFRHVGIVVKDIQTQLFFYQELLGLELYYHEIEKGIFLDTLLGDDGLSPSIYKLGNKGNTLVELLDFGSNLHSVDIKTSLLQNGYTHFSITINDLDYLYNRLCENKVEFINPPRISDNGKFKVCFCRDFENNFIELVEILNQ
ncbi:MAG: VOC family protein [Parachlamydiaceae bacterium]|nr:VOC family protein [Parachlamydiaceae bacterium]